MIADLGKGALPDPIDERDYIAPIMGAAQVDWSKDFILPEPPNSDQANSLRCVSEAWSYYHWQLKGKRFSPRDIYSQIFLPEGGAYIREGGLIPVKNGQQTIEECADGSPVTEANSRIRCANPENALDDLEANSFLIKDGTIDGIALALEQYKGVVFGVWGSNPGWVDMANPRPPAQGEANWGHALYAFGHHMHNGLKCIIAKSSWCNTGVTRHHIKENYFAAGSTFNAWTLIPKEQQVMTNALLVQNGQEYGVFLPATSEDGLITLMRNVGMPVPLTPEGKLDWSKVVASKQLV